MRLFGDILEWKTRDFPNAVSNGVTQQVIVLWDWIPLLRDSYIVLLNSRAVANSLNEVLESIVMYKNQVNIV